MRRLHFNFIRRVTTVTRNVEHRESNAEKMNAWQIHGYGDLSELQKSSARIPHINAPDEVLVQVEAASVNPLDVAMINGYGSTAFNILRGSDVEFPLTLGRDFSGRVVWRGPLVQDLQPGDRVWGVLPPHWQGSHADYTVSRRCWMAPQPSSLNSVEAASLPYAALTAWSALYVWAGLGLVSTRGRRVLVLGAAGGVGSAAVQMLRAADAFVVCSCSTDAIPLVQTLGADVVLDRKHADYTNSLKEFGPYDVVLDCAGLGASEASTQQWECSTYVTLSTPVLQDMDARGAVAGVAGSALKLLCNNIDAMKKGRTVRWAYFVPSQNGMLHLQKLVNNGKLRPIISEVFGRSEVPQAYKRVQDGHLRGKVVIDFNKDSGDD